VGRDKEIEKETENGMKGTGEGGSYIYTNEEGKSIWQRHGFWYIGDMSSWPPQTYFRCLDMPCTYNRDFPSLEGYKVTKEYEETYSTPPILQKESCEMMTE